MTDRIRKILLVLDGEPTADRIHTVSMIRGVAIAEAASVRSIGPCIAVVLENQMRDDDYEAGLAGAFASLRFVVRTVPIVDGALDMIASTDADHRFRVEIHSVVAGMRPVRPAGTIAQEKLSEHLDVLASWSRYSERVERLLSQDMGKAA